MTHMGAWGVQKKHQILRLEVVMNFLMRVRDQNTWPLERVALNF